MPGSFETAAAIEDLAPSLGSTKLTAGSVPARQYCRRECDRRASTAFQWRDHEHHMCACSRPSDPPSRISSSTVAPTKARSAFDSGLAFAGETSKSMASSAN
jgi:hypothetical protein